MYRSHSTWGETHKQVPHTSITQEYDQNYPVKLQKSKPYTRTHRVILRSVDKTSGTIDDATFKVDLPHIKSGKCKLVIENFFMTTNANLTEFNNNYYHIHLKQYNQPLSYSSSTKGTTDIIATLKGVDYLAGSLPTHEAVGIPISDTSIFKGVLNIAFSSTSITSLSTKLGEWVLTLVVVEEDE